ncbi:hypothetical protein K503DRAFT_772251 [Rhizopogon vinicolor AM-OR11-026]|uniref:Uncharacterized protein n=1 Tax=Rhizopogon vinicolor AM-OR11-026 TaxID=1314800 RepID=A0A1B7MVU0_9AGAM|nr:hypothetical protein K503DRAFT_772251 [Rhizopogon vinicolor AM-OR11-026]
MPIGASAVLTASCLFLCLTYHLQAIPRNVLSPPRFLGAICGVKSVRCEAAVVGILGGICEGMGTEMDENPLVGIFRQIYRYRIS